MRNIEVNKKDMINHPEHYKSSSGLETIDVIKAFTEDLNGFDAVATANILKYVCRWKKKNGIEDLKKAQWYLNELIKQHETHSIKFDPGVKVSYADADGYIIFGHVEKHE